MSRLLKGPSKELFAHVVAQNVYGVGFSTLIADLLHNVALLQERAKEAGPGWLEYCQSQNQRLFLVSKLNAFYNQPFSAAFFACHKWEDALLLAIVKPKNKTVLLNPGPQYVITKGDEAIILCSESGHNRKIFNIEKGMLHVSKGLNNNSVVNDADQKNKADKKEKKMRQSAEKCAYHQLSVPSFLAAASLHTVEDVKFSNNHILICGNPNTCGYLPDLLLALRRKYWSLNPIVVMDYLPPSDKIWAKISLIPQLYIIKGDPLSASDLKRAGAESAASIVLVSKWWSKKKGNPKGETPAVPLVQVHNVLTTGVNATARITIALGRMQNSETGRDSTQKKEEQITSHPSHASSELISYNMLSNWLMKATQECRYVGLAAEQLIRGIVVSKKMSQLPGGIFLGKEKTYSTLLTELFRKTGQIVLGLYHEESPLGVDPDVPSEDLPSYICTHPAPNRRLTAEDTLLVLYPNDSIMAPCYAGIPMVSIEQDTPSPSSNCEEISITQIFERNGGMVSPSDLEAVKPLQLSASQGTKTLRRVVPPKWLEEDNQDDSENDDDESELIFSEGHEAVMVSNAYRQSVMLDHSLSSILNSSFISPPAPSPSEENSGPPSPTSQSTSPASSPPLPHSRTSVQQEINLSTNPRRAFPLKLMESKANLPVGGSCIVGTPRPLGVSAGGSFIAGTPRPSGPGHLFGGHNKKMPMAQPLKPYQAARKSSLQDNPTEAAIASRQTPPPQVQHSGKPADPDSPWRHQREKLANTIQAQVQELQQKERAATAITEPFKRNSRSKSSRSSSSRSNTTASTTTHSRDNTYIIVSPPLQRRPSESPRGHVRSASLQERPSSSSSSTPPSSGPVVPSSSSPQHE